MKKETLLIAGIALVVGILVGIIFTRGGKEAGPRQASAPPAAAPPAVNFQQNIQQLERLVAQDPGNRNAWVQLGHNYFDSNQPTKAIEAYNKALELDPNDPDVLTDQGVMFRQMGWYDRAIENFTKAHEIDPSHQQSLFNLGVVYRYDLQDFERAKEAWRKFLALNPSGSSAEQIRKELEFLETHPAIPQQQ